MRRYRPAGGRGGAAASHRLHRGARRLRRRDGGDAARAPALPGMGRTIASRFRDKLAMRMQARTLGIRVPEFTRGVQRPGGRRLGRPRAAAVGAQAALVGGGDRHQEDRRSRRAVARARRRGRRSGAVPARAVRPGRRLPRRLDRLRRRVVFAVASRYGRPPMEVAHQGGLFVTRRLPDESEDARALLDGEPAAAAGFGLGRGVSHTEFIRGVGRAGDVFSRHRPVSAAPSSSTPSRPRPGSTCGASGRRSRSPGKGGVYAVPPHRDGYAGIVLTLARQETPDMSAYTDPEIAMTIRKDHHAGLIVARPSRSGSRR